MENVSEWGETVTKEESLVTIRVLPPRKAGFQR